MPAVLRFREKNIPGRRKSKCEVLGQVRWWALWKALWTVIYQAKGTAAEIGTWGLSHLRGWCLCRKEPCLNFINLYSMDACPVICPLQDTGSPKGT